MEKLLNDVFVLNGLIEIGGGISGLLLPWFMFPHAKNDIHVRYVSVWWSFAALSLGLLSLSFSKGMNFIFSLIRL